MKQSEIFGLAVRLAGLWMLLYAFWCLITAASNGIWFLSSLFDPTSNRVTYITGCISWIVCGIISLALGVISLLHVDRLVKITYKEG